MSQMEANTLGVSLPFPLSQAANALWTGEPYPKENID